MIDAHAPDDVSFAIGDEMTIYRAAELCTSLQAAFAGLPAGATLALDLAAVTDIDSAGVQLLIAARKTAAQAGCGLRLAGHSEAVADVVRTLNLARHVGDLAPAAAAAL